MRDKLFYLEREKMRLINDLRQWWVENGWNPDRLHLMTIGQLVAIRRRRERSGWVSKTHPTNYGQQVMVPEAPLGAKRIVVSKRSHLVYPLDRETILAHIAECKAALQGGRPA
jgi:hypothetical protein